MIRSHVLPLAMLFALACDPPAPESKGPPVEDDANTATLVVYFGDADAEAIKKQTLDFSQETDPEVVQDGVGFPRGMHAHDGDLLVADSNEDLIWRISLDDGGSSSFGNALNAYGVTVVENQKVFWIENEGTLEGAVRSANLDGSNVTNVAPVVGPVDIVNDDEALYVSTARLLQTQAVQGDILKISFDGTEVEVLFDVTANLGDFRAGPMHIDGNTLIVAQQNGGKVVAINISDGSFETIFEDDDIRIQGMHILGNRIFFSDWAAKGIREFNTETEQLRTWIENIERPMDVFVTAP